MSEESSHGGREQASPFLYYVRLSGRAGTFDNLGDYLGRVLFEKISGRDAIRVGEAHVEPYFSTVGSIVEAVCGYKSIIWGSGLHYSNRCPAVSPECTIRAVRGPLTARILGLSHSIPVGDPALLMPAFYRPDKIGPEFLYGVIPHFRDIQVAAELLTQQKEESSLLLNVLTSDYKSFITDLTRCRLILSSSLHGIILAHAYGVPAIWVKFSNNVPGEGFKFRDYFYSVSIPIESQLDLTNLGGYSFSKVVNKAIKERVPTQIVNFNYRPLIDSCPFMTDDAFEILSRYFG